MNGTLTRSWGPALVATMLLGSRLQAAAPTLDPTYGTHSVAKNSIRPQAQCIWSSSIKDHQTVYLRRAFRLQAVPKTARFAVVADDSCTVTINGNPVILPATPPGSYGVAAVTDVASLLVTGKNVISATAFNGVGAAALLLRLDTDERPLALSGPDWKVTETQPSADWTTSKFDDSTWSTATVIGPAFGGPWGGNVKGWPTEDAEVPYLSHIELLPVHVELLPGTGSISGADTLIRTGTVHLVVQPSSVESTNPASLVLDFGREVAGRILIKGSDGAHVEVGTGESREECVKAPWGGPHVLALKLGSAEATPNSAFRYVRLQFFGTKPFVITDLAMDDIYYPVQYKGAFDCSDPLLTKIWYTGAYTAHLGMQQDIYDGPKRDRLLWSGDMQVSGEVINTVFADKFLMEKDLTSLRAGIQGSKPDTEMPSSEINSIPGYTAAWFCTLADFYRHSGDDAYLRGHHDLILSLLRYEQTDFDANNLYTNPHRAWDFVDWSDGLSNWNPEGRFEDTPDAQTTTDLFLIHGIRDATFLLRALNDTENTAKYTAWADQLTEAARQHLADPKTHTYTARRQGNVMAILSGVATTEQQTAISSTVLKPNSPDWSHDMTPYYGGYLLAAYSRLNRTQDGLDYARLFWGGMIAQGGTTFWERYNPSWKSAGPDLALSPAGGDYEMSLCHAWSSGVTSWLTEDVLGVRPTSGGYRTVEIAPNLGDLRWVSGDIPTPRGLIRVRAERSGQSLKCRVTLPPGVDATVRLPGKTVRLRTAGNYVVESK